MLRIIRTTAAVASFLAIALFFLDFSGTVPGSFALLERIQLVPAILAGSLGVLAALAVAALLFGRLYCSILCPLGVFQDLLARIVRRSKKRNFRYAPGRPGWRYLFFVLAAGLGILSAGLLGLFDPYAIFGRIMTTCFAPIWRFGNNLLAEQLGPHGITTFYRVEMPRSSALTALAAFGSLALVGFFAVRYGRLYCNTVCPVGALLGFFSRFAFLKIRIDRAQCVSCGKCAARCKASCVNAKEKRVDSSRCVVCFDCLGDCPKNAIRFGLPASSEKESRSEAVAKSAAREKSGEENAAASETPSSATESKRLFLSTLFSLSAAALGSSAARAAAAEVPEISYNGRVPYKRRFALSPPGSQSHAHFQTHCVSCHLCVAKCPSKTLRPSLFEFGPAGILQPTVVFDRSFCNFDCTVCGEVCPTGAILPLTKEEKHRAQIGRVEFIRENCVVVTDRTNCGACAEHCPTQAVHMVPFEGELTIPEIKPELCVGCGACESICPVRPFRAVHVEGLPVHERAAAPPVEEKIEKPIDDFGF